MVGDITLYNIIYVWFQKKTALKKKLQQFLVSKVKMPCASNLRSFDFLYHFQI